MSQVRQLQWLPHAAAIRDAGQSAPDPQADTGLGQGRRAIAIGDPLGASSTRIMTTMVKAVEQRRSRPFLAT